MPPERQSARRRQGPTHQRRSVRLTGYDYSQAGAYFLTICTHRRGCVVAEVVEAQIRLNACGAIVEACWEQIPRHFRHVELDAFVVMPNHLHGVIVFLERSAAEPDVRLRARHAVPLRGRGEVVGGQVERFGAPVRSSLATIIRSFKAAVTRRINAARQTTGRPFWQRNYYEHIIRNEHDLEDIREYIEQNPGRWEEDENNPRNIPRGS